jgi:hypothetical protein
MRTLRASVAALAVAIVLFQSTASTGMAQDQRKPLLSEEIRRVLEADGPEAAQRRFDEIFPDQADRFEIDMPAMGQLAADRGQAGDMESLQVIYEMIATLTPAQMAEHAPEVAAAVAAQEEADREAAERAAAERAAREEAATAGLGPARDDLERFAGDYGEPDKQGPGARNLFVGWTCDGYLLMGASWGDAAPWQLESVGETKFKHAGPYRSFAAEFELDESGKPIALIHDMDDLGLPSRLESVEPPWEPECLPVERGH